ncbi:MAG TPA: GNAT family N-acetyltransferase, partial [Solirubrobacteraceae bacterium]|nr:GNAT family N-acetyltransferase [Solirubrobacteraceae bacterium]
ERESASVRERAEAFVRAATSDRLDHADALLADDPTIVRALPAAALVVGRPIDVDPNAPLAPLGWPPLVLVTHSRYLGGPRTDALVETATRLLDGGADPDSAYQHPQFGAQSALYGAAGLAHEPRMTRLLLERGASTDDDESVYHATEALDHTSLRLLLEAGAAVAGTNALAHALDREDLSLLTLLLDHGPAVGEPWPERDRAVAWAVFRNRSVRTVRLLAERGAALDRIDRRSGRRPYALAVARGRNDLADALAVLGARPRASELDRLLGDCLRGDRPAALARVAAHPELAAEGRDELGAALVTAAAEGRVEAIALLADIGAPLETRGDLGGTALHHAAWNGRGGSVDILLRRGADPLAPAPEPAAGTPLAWAAHGSRHAGGGGGAYEGIGRRLVAEGDVRDPALAEVATGGLADWLAGREQEPAPVPAAGAIDHGARYAAIDVARLRALAASAAATVLPVGDGFAVRTGVLDNTLNGVVCDACDEAAVAEAIAWLDGLPACWHVTEGSALGPALVAAGSRSERDAVVMGAPAASLALDRPDTPWAITRVTDADALGAWLVLFEQTGMLEGPSARAAYDAVLHVLALHRGSPFTLLAAHDGDELVGGIGTFRDGPTLLVEHLAVADGVRRRGIGRALIATALGAAPGVDEVVLGPTPTSIPFYERLGFVLQRLPHDRIYYLPAGSA